MSDPLSAAIEAAVARTIRDEIPAIIKGVSDALRQSKPEPVPAGTDRFIKLSEACKILSMHKTTIFRQERKGRLPPRRRIGSATGYLQSDIDAILIGRKASKLQARPVYVGE